MLLSDSYIYKQISYKWNKNTQLNQMANSTTYMKRCPKFQNRKSLDLSLLSTQPLKKRPQNLSLKPMPLRASHATFCKQEPMNICETDSSIEYDKKGPAEIRPFLYLGSQAHASKLKTLRDFKIDAILNVTTEIENYFPNEGFEYCNCPVLDSPVTNIYTIFESCFAFIDKIRNSGRKLLVHCHAGVSRSTTICVAYLMRTEGMKYEHAMNWVRMCRPIVAPNFGFLTQLIDYEKILQSNSIMRRARASSYHGVSAYSLRPKVSQSIASGLESPAVVHFRTEERFGILQSSFAV